MKLHLPKQLFTALLAAITLAAPAAWGESLYVEKGGNFYGGNHSFVFTLNPDLLSENDADLLAAYWNSAYASNTNQDYAANAYQIKFDGTDYTFTAGRGRLSSTTLDDSATLTSKTDANESTTSAALTAGHRYLVQVSGGDQNQVVTLVDLDAGSSSTPVSLTYYKGNMNGGNYSIQSTSTSQAGYGVSAVYLWNATGSDSVDFSGSNFWGTPASITDKNVFFAANNSSTTYASTVNVTSAERVANMDVYGSYTFAGGSTDATGSLTVTGNLNIAAGASAIFNVASTLSGTVTNNGTLTASNGTLSGTVTNNGTLTASNGTLGGTVTNNGTLNLAGFTVAAGTTASITGTGTTTLSGTVTNNGTLNLEGFTVAANTEASITGTGATTLSGAVTNNGSLTLNNATLHSSVTNNGTLNLNGALNISSLAGLEQSGSYSDGNNGVFTGSFSVVTSGAEAVLNRGDSFALQLNGSALSTSTDAATYYTYDSSTGSIKINETGNQTYWINTNASYDASNGKMLNAESFTVAAGAEFYLTDASVLSKTLIPTDTSKVYFRASGSETNLLRFTGASGGAGLSLTATVDTTTQKVTTGSSASSYAGNIIVLEGTTLELGATVDVAVAGKTYIDDKNRFITVESGATLDVKGNEAYYHVVLEDGATLTNSGNAVNTGWKALPYVELHGDATIKARSNMVMQKGGSDDSGTFQLALNGHKLTKTGDNMLYLQNVSIGSGTLQIDKGTVETADRVTLVSGAALDVIINDGTLKTGSALSLRNLTLGAGADAVNVNSNTLTVTGNTHAAGTFTKTGAGTLKLQGATTFGGGVNVNGGTLELAGSVGTQVLSGTNSIGAGNLKITTNDVIDYTNSTNTEINGATLTLDSRQTVDDGNTFTLTNGTIAGTGATYNDEYTAGLDIYQNMTVINSSGTSSISTGLGLRSSTSKAKFNVTADTLTTSGVIAGAGGVVKTGAGELVLEGANTYTGGTSIEAGKLTVKHAGALGTGGVNMTGGELNVAEGIGLVLGGALTAAADSTLTLNNGSSLTLGAASTIAGTVTGAGNIASNLTPLSQALFPGGLAALPTVLP